MYALCTLTCLCSIIKQLGQKEKATLFLSNNTTTLGNHFDLLISRGSKYSFNSFEIIALLILVAKPLPINYQKSRGVYFPNQLVFYKSGKARQFWPLRKASLRPEFGTSVPSRLMNLFSTNDNVDKSITILCDTFGKVFQLVSTGCSTDGILFSLVRSTSSTPPPPSGRTYIAQWHHFLV